jgi:hypothetical protein
MKKIIYPLAFILTLNACSRKPAAVTPPPVKTKPALAVHDTLISPPAPAGEEFIPGVVKKYELDGCSYIIELTDGSKLEPINLPEEFRKDSLKVMVKYTEQKEMGSICMVGKIVKIDGIKMMSQ